MIGREIEQVTHCLDAASELRHGHLGISQFTCDGDDSRPAAG
jgi:hypothetical protein